MVGFWILLLLLILLIAAGPWWPYSRGWGYWPGGVVLALLILWLVLIWWGVVLWSWPWVVA